MFFTFRIYYFGEKNLIKIFKTLVVGSRAYYTIEFNYDILHICIDNNTNENIKMSICCKGVADTSIESV